MRNPRLLQLLSDNRGVNAKARGVRIECAASGGEATIYLYDVIVGSELEAEWFGGVTAQSLVPQIDQLKVDTIHLRINSPGGDIFAAQTISAALKRNKARVIAHIDGLAASAATAIAMAADQVLIDKGAMFMIHNAWTIAMGDKNDFVETADLLDKVDQALAAQYAGKTGLSAGDVAKLMDAETWFTGQEAVDAKFADALDGEPDADDAAAKAMWNLAAFDKAPKQAAAAPAEDAPTVADYERRARLKALFPRAA
jgi:ATP-dependent Clp protease protease subunit